MQTMSKTRRINKSSSRAITIPARTNKIWGVYIIIADPKVEVTSSFTQNYEHL